jgi:hypothetical protein
MSQVARAQAANACTTTNALAVGNYGFILTAGTFIPVTANPPGTTSSTIFEPLAVTPPGSNPYSSTELGRLLSGVAGVTAGSATGILYFDGAGNIFASQSVTGVLSTRVGSYTVDTNCGISVTLGDVFSAQNPPKQVTFSGALVGNGSEIDIIPSSQFPTNTGQTTSPIMPPTSFVQLVKTATPATCNAATLAGPYLLIGTGLQAGGVIATSPAVSQTFPFVARVRFDGNGNIIPEPTSTPGLSQLQYTGTYTVNPDCSGVMTISQPPATPTGTTTKTTTPRTTTAPFLISNPIVQVNSNGVVAFQNVSGLRSSILFSFANQDQIVSGIGRAQ